MVHIADVERQDDKRSLGASKDSSAPSALRYSAEMAARSVGSIMLCGYNFFAPESTARPVVEELLATAVCRRASGEGAGTRNRYRNNFLLSPCSFCISTRVTGPLCLRSAGTGRLILAVLHPQRWPSASGATHGWDFSRWDG
jgi:hypothetical protein